MDWTSSGKESMKYFKNVFVYTLFLLALVIFCIFAIGLSANHFALSLFQDKVQAFLVADILRAIFVFLFVFVATKYIYKIDSNVIFKSHDKILLLGHGITIGLIMIFLGFFILYFLNAIEWVMPESFKPFYFSIFVTILTSATTAFWEELIMRGFFLRVLLLRFSNSAALILSSSLFGLAHLLGPSPSVLVVFSTFFAGILLGLVFIKTKNIYQCIGLHFSWNCAQYILFSKKIFSVKYVNTILAGDSTFEEGLVAIVITILFAVIIRILQNDSSKREHRR